MAFGLRDLASVAITATDQTSPAFDSLKRNIADLRGGIGSLQGMLAGLGVGVSAGGFALMIKGAIDAQAALDDLQDTTALTVETLSSLQQTARIGGHSFDQVTATATKFAKSVAEAAGGNKELLRSFDALGISQERLRSGKFDDLYTEFATKIANAENKTYAIAHATDLAGKSAANALPFFKDLAETGLEQARVTMQQTEAADKLQKQIGRLGNEFDTFKSQLATDVVPWLQKMIAEMNEGIRIAGGFGAALKLGMMLPTDNPGQKAAGYKQEIDELMAARARYVKSNSDTSAIDQAIQSLEQKRQFLLFQQRQQALALGGGQDANDRRAASTNRFVLGAPTATPGAADNSGPQLIAQLSAQLAELNGEGSEVDKVIRKLADGTKEYSLAVQASALAIAGEIDERKRQRKEIDEGVAAYDRAIKAQEAADKVLADFNKTQAEALKNLEFETSLLVMNDSQREQAIALRKLENEYLQASIQLVGEENDAYIRRMETTRQIYQAQKDALPGAVDANVAAKAAIEANKKMVEEAKRSYDQLTESLTDALLRGFESGKGFAENFRETLKNMFSTLILRPLIQPIAQGGAGAITGLLGGMGIPGYANAGGGIGGSGSSGLNLFQNANAMFNLNSGASFAVGYGSTAGLSAVEAAALIESGTVGFAGAGMEAGALGMSASGMGGTALSTALPYVGMALAAYSLLKGSKGGPASFTGLDVSGTASGSGLLSSQWTGNAANNKQGFSWQSHDHNATGGMNTLIQGVFDDMKRLGDKLGLNTSGLSTTSVPFSFRTTAMGNGGGPTTQEVIDAFGQNVHQLTDQLALGLMPNLKAFAQAGESATQTLVRMVEVQEQLLAAETQAKANIAGAVRGLPGALGITGLEGARNALSVSEYVSPMDRLTSARGLLDSTFQDAMGGDLSAVNAFPQLLQQALSIGRDVGASGPAFQSLFQEGNKQLNELLTKQEALRVDLLRGVDLSIIQVGQDTVGELRKVINTLVDGFNRVQEELRRVREGT